VLKGGFPARCPRRKSALVVLSSGCFTHSWNRRDGTKRAELRFAVPFNQVIRERSSTTVRVLDGEMSQMKLSASQKRLAPLGA
jgi:hypothetical protein